NIIIKGGCKKMILVIEGPKRCGKTTFCKKVKSLFSSPVFWINERTTLNFNTIDQRSASMGSIISMMNMAFEIEKEYEDRDDEPIIMFDRFHISEIVYGKQLRKYDVSYMYAIDELLANKGVKGILMTSDTIKSRYDGQAYEVDFEVECSRSKIPFVKFNLDNTQGIVLTRDIIRGVLG
ncbi:hypothetical protein, partial [Segatella hominis]|uniref:hypothetical protein n=1 Tax=Segatella hominis TaxID=2518605 RepID=UPI003AB21FDF